MKSSYKIKLQKSAKYYIDYYKVLYILYRQLKFIGVLNSLS